MVNSVVKTAPECLAEIKNIEQANTKINQIKKLLEKYPRYISAWLELGLLYRQQGDRMLALSSFEQGLKVKSNHQQLKLELATEQLFLDKLDDCRQNLIEFLQLAPENIQGSIKLSKVYQKEYNFERGEELLQTALTYHPDNFNLLVEIGQLEKKRANLEQALVYLEQAINKYPQKIQGHLIYLDILWDLGQVELVKDKLEELQGVYPENFLILIHTGNLYRKLGQREQALFWFNLAENKAATTVRFIIVNTSIIKELQALGRLKLAVDKLDFILERFPNNIPLQIIKANILKQQHKLIEAVTIYQKNLQIEPSNLESRLELAKVYCQIDKVESAISLLQETEQILGSNLKLLIQIGRVHQDLSEYNQARHWYRKACEEYPEQPQGYCSLANLMVLERDISHAIKLLQETESKIANNAPVILRIIQLQTQSGNLDLSLQLLTKELTLSPDNTQLLWQLCQVYIKQGKYNLALEVLDRISTDEQESIKRTEQLKAIIYLWQGNLTLTETYLNRVIAKSAFASSDRDRLAIVYALTGRVELAFQQLKIATEQLSLETTSGLVNLPLRSITGMMINDLRSNPPMLVKLQATLEKTGFNRIYILANLLTQEPMYLGAALYLAKELREQNIFSKMQQTLSNSPGNTSLIPQRIVQFWDDTQLPTEVEKICQSWRDHNPNYQYIIFSLDKAIAFLEKNYDSKVMQAFNNCHHAATQSDFFRLAYLNKKGGFYADVDDQCLQSLDPLVNLNSELIVAQGLRSNIENDFIGCIPGQVMISAAFNQAVESLTNYCNESPWFITGPGLITSAICSNLVPYLTDPDYPNLPQILVLNQSELRQTVQQHLPLAYKKTNKSWNHDAKRKIKFAFNH